jgi:hypothetical protein
MMFSRQGANESSLFHSTQMMTYSIVRTPCERIASSRYDPCVPYRTVWGHDTKLHRWLYLS